MQGFEVAVKEFLASISAFTRAFAEAQVPVGILVQLVLFEKGFFLGGIGIVQVSMPEIVLDFAVLNKIAARSARPWS